MKNIHGIYLPDHEEHLVKEFAHGPGWTYQTKKLDMAMKHCIPRKLAIDIGGHCGLWSMHLTKLFEEVVAFEPNPDHRECYTMNVNGNYTLHPCGLGAREMRASIHTTEGSSGDSWVEPGDTVDIKTLDSFNLKPDFIKIDTEGFEYFIIQGGEETIKMYRPVMIVEQKAGKGSHFGLDDRAAIDLLESWGYRVAEHKSGDYVCVSS